MHQTTTKGRASELKETQQYVKNILVQWSKQAPLCLHPSAQTQHLCVCLRVCCMCVRTKKFWNIDHCGVTKGWMWKGWMSWILFLVLNWGKQKFNYYILPLEWHFLFFFFTVLYPKLNQFSMCCLLLVLAWSLSKKHFDVSCGFLWHHDIVI